MTLRAIIVDDESTAIENLKLILEKYVLDVKVIGHTTQPSKALTLIEDYRPDLVFLDITMPEMDGFEMLDQLNWKKFCLIFITAHQEFGLKALKQNAIDYLLKPIDYEELILAVNRATEKLKDSSQLNSVRDYATLRSLNAFSSKKLAVASKHSVESVLPSDIIYLESKSNYTYFSLVNSKSILSPKTLKEFDSLLCDNIMFMRVHHSFIINLQMVQRYLKNDELIVMNNGQNIALSRNRKNGFLSWLNTSVLR